MSQKKHRLYEGMFIISASLTDAARQKAVDRITEGVTGFGGEIVKMHDMGRKRLAYSIDSNKGDGRRYRDGHYLLVYFNAEPSAIEKLWQEYRHHEDLLRFITLSAESVMEELVFKSIGEE